MKTLLIGIFLFWFIGSGFLNAQPDDQKARIGVLAYRGETELHREWIGLRDYLNVTISGWSFEIIPITLSSADAQIRTGQIDFVVTNPGHFTNLDRDHRMSVLATRVQQKSDGTFSDEFGSAIIARNDGTIESLEDIAGSHLLAVDRDAFGGFQLAWYELDRIGLDLFADTELLEFSGFPMDQIVARVLSGDADVGIVRSGLMERLVNEGRVASDAFVVLNSDATYAHPDAVSTALYPEWPFAALSTVPPELKNSVALALLMSSDSATTRETEMIDRWSAPAPYHGVADVMTAYLARDTSPNRQNLMVWTLTLGAILIAATIAWRHVPQIVPTRQKHAELLSENNFEKLTHRERQVLDLVVTGKSTKQIAIDLGVSPKTVEFHRSNILRKYGAKTSIELIGRST